MCHGRCAGCSDKNTHQPATGRGNDCRPAVPATSTAFGAIGGGAGEPSSVVSTALMATAVDGAAIGRGGVTADSDAAAEFALAIVATGALAFDGAAMLRLRQHNHRTDISAYHSTRTGDNDEDRRKRSERNECRHRFFSKTINSDAKTKTACDIQQWHERLGWIIYLRTKQDREHDSKHFPTLSSKDRDDWHTACRTFHVTSRQLGVIFRKIIDPLPDLIEKLRSFSTAGLMSEVKCGTSASRSELAASFEFAQLFDRVMSIVVFAPFSVHSLMPFV